MASKTDRQREIQTAEREEVHAFREADRLKKLVADWEYKGYVAQRKSECLNRNIADEKLWAEGFSEAIEKVAKYAADLEGTESGNEWDNGSGSLCFDRACRDIAEYARSLLASMNQDQEG